MAKGNRIQIAGKVDDFQKKKNEIYKFLITINGYKCIKNEYKWWFT